MIRRKGIERPEYIYPHDEWRMVEKRFHPELLPQAETFLATGNGYLGLRGNFDEGRPAFDTGTFVNGFYESWPIIYGEEAFGFARTGQTIVGVPDAKIIRLHVDDEPFHLPTADLLDFERALDMRGGTLDRELLWETPAGKHVSIKSRRIVSFLSSNSASPALRLMPRSSAIGSSSSGSSCLSSRCRIVRSAVESSMSSTRSTSSFAPSVPL